MNAVVNKAEVNDITILNKISIESKMYWNYPKEWIDRWLDDLTLTEKDFLDQHVYKIDKSGSIIGFCSMKEKENAYEIMHLWIKPEFIGMGYGKLLLNDTIKKVVTNGKVIIVEADPNSESFYSSQGFITFDKTESYPKGRFLPIMKKQLPA